LPALEEAFEPEDFAPDDFGDAGAFEPEGLGAALGAILGLGAALEELEDLEPEDLEDLEPDGLEDLEPEDLEPEDLEPEDLGEAFEPEGFGAALGAILGLGAAFGDFTACSFEADDLEPEALGTAFLDAGAALGGAAFEDLELEDFEPDDFEPAFEDLEDFEPDDFEPDDFGAPFEPEPEREEAFEPDDLGAPDEAFEPEVEAWLTGLATLPPTAAAGLAGALAATGAFFASSCDHA
jgi:hypothetical protein